MELGVLTSSPMGTGDNMYQRLIEEYADQRVLFLNEEIDDCILENYVIFILKWNQEDNQAGIPYKKRKPIRIFVNSPGGDIFSGNMLIDVIEQSKTPVIGISLSMVGSMAYHIYLSCHERLAFKDSVFVQHEGSVAVSNSASKAKDTMEFFDQMDKRLEQHILDRTNMDAEYLKSKATNEYFMYAEEAKELGIVHKIIGIDVPMNYIL